ncbi:hypothetical protein BUALT_Bualt01G0178400 [Buddleja alternifolia]|uniref:SOSEKI DIX-like domain-containing protein n=1 Tax=Buddleja alternifolia TaxID=168488 RepID=A0AAV6YDW7_9LAMI|nr:hypothetical protein BUALT_Bualt01G0178400 [Buddleja alternifolia]
MTVSAVESMEDMAFENLRMVKRRLMEAQGGEVRRLHIVYFLSRKGRIEHPHLIRVHHLSRNGVRLRDIKRWLGELRGKEMPESFSWSYKRVYKTGYVWQDLLDDDLITPISDNEYVLKGSEISSTIKDISYPEQKVVTKQEDHKTLHKEENQSNSSETTSMYVSTKSSSEIEEESPTFGSETSTLTDDSGKLDTDKNSSVTKHDEKPEKSENSLNKKNKTSSDGKDEKNTSNISSSKSKSKSNNSSNIFRNLISCGAVDTNDSAVVAMKNKQNKPLLNMCSSDLRNVHSAEICKRDRIGGSQRILGTPNWTHQQWSGRKSFDGGKDSAKNKSELRDQKAPCAAYKPVNWPNCSQCGKPFKPEKLHAHMKSCKGMKAMTKTAAAAATSGNTTKGSNEYRNEASVSSYLLTR